MAPSCSQSLLRPSSGSLTSTRAAPARRAERITDCPIGPPPSTSTRSPSRTPARLTACTATAIGSMSAPYSIGMASGSRTTLRDGTVRASANAATTSGATPMTYLFGECCSRPAYAARSDSGRTTGLNVAIRPTGNDSGLTPSPSAAMRPTDSWPIT